MVAPLRIAILYPAFVEKAICLASVRRRPPSIAVMDPEGGLWLVSIIPPPHTGPQVQLTFFSSIHLVNQYPLGLWPLNYFFSFFFSFFRNITRPLHFRAELVYYVQFVLITYN